MSAEAGSGGGGRASAATGRSAASAARGEIAVIGSPQFTLGFRLAGIRRIWDAEGPDDLHRALAAARKDPDITILVMETADVGALEPRVRHEIVKSVRPTLVAVGDEEDDSLREKIKQAVGVDLW